MTIKDRDLKSVQQARQFVETAYKAWQSFAHFSQEHTDRIVKAAAEAASGAAEEMARLAVTETGFGRVEHKFIKNKFAAEGVFEFIRDLKTVGIIAEYPERRVYEIAEPVGVVAAVIPSTNPTSTAIYKVLISLKARNAVVLSPHPSAKRCICETVEVMRRAAEAAGLPPGVIQCMDEVSLEGTQELMAHRRTAVVLATGGMGLVRAAYSSGKPAFGVGPGNVPAYVESSADIEKAVRDILTGKSFDNGTLCCSEQAIICDQAIEERVRERIRAEGGHLLSDEDARRLAEIAVLPSRLANPEIVGKSAEFIAQKAGISVPKKTRALVVELDGVGRDYPLSIEKLSPILAFYVVQDWQEGCERAKQILRYGGMGHTLSIHSQRDDVIREFALQKPASRIIANSPATHGAVGFSTGLSPAMTLGCGSYGGNITSDNITPLHLINRKRLAYEIRPVDLNQALVDFGFGVRSEARAKALREVRPADSGQDVPGSAGSLEERVAEYLVRRGVSAGAVPGSRGPDPSFEGETTRDLPSSAALSGSQGLTPPPVGAYEFISEDDVRAALNEGRKLPVGPETVITPSARDLGNEQNVFLRV